MIDAIDRKLIIELQKDGRASYAALAKRLHTSVSTVSRRIRQLRKQDIIKITAIPEPKKVGYTSMAVIALDVEMTKIDEVCAKLATYPRIYFIAVCFGRFDIILSLNSTSSEMLADFVKNELSRIDGIMHAETFYVAELKKQTFGGLSEDGTANKNTKTRKRAAKAVKKSI